MEYLVTMTTHVPDGTSEAAVEEIRTREAARSAQLATEGHLLRLWRPPLQPGEWRSLGLFSADDGVELERVLASMPLRVWRSDQVTPLSPHPNDPARQAGQRRGTATGPGGTEFLTTVTVAIPAGTASEIVDTATRGQADRERELAGQGYLERLWTLSGQDGALGLWQAPDPAAMDEILASLPLSPWMSVHTTPLTRHPSDPQAAGG
jgi:muconolactone delta-isomerase